MADYDLAIIGGGINGAGIARDAAGRGLRVLLLEQNDLGSGTSSASTKLIHGGLRYLEHGAFRPGARGADRARGAAARRAAYRAADALRAAGGAGPALAVHAADRPVSVRLAGRAPDPAAAPARSISPITSPASRCCGNSRAGFEYSDCWVDDARLVALNAVDAAERGATVRTRTRVARAEREDIWRLILKAAGRREVVTARVLVNAAGPWAGIVNETVLRLGGSGPLRLAKGSHIVVRKLFDHGRGYIFQNSDKRVVFALPFAEDFTLIGTTDENFAGDLDSVAPSARRCCTSAAR